MNDLQPTIWIRINGIGHAFSREIGCDCGRCQTINFTMIPPPGTLKRFDGWDDPPWRAHTSVSIMIPDKEGSVDSHILIDVGAGVVDSLVSSKLEGLERIKGILISHWHPDHVLGLNQLCESLKRSSEIKGIKFVKVPVYCTLKTYKHLRDKGGFSYEFDHRLCFHEILPEVPFKIDTTPPVTITALEVAHGKVKGSVIYIADIGQKKVVFGWDIDVPDAERTSNGKKNAEVIRKNLHILKGTNLLLMPSNTWVATGTGHTSFLFARQYIGEIKAKKTLLVHLSGHEDGKGNIGYGWSDSDWASQVSKYGVGVARQGMLIEI